MGMDRAEGPKRPCFEGFLANLSGAPIRPYQETVLGLRQAVRSLPLEVLLVGLHRKLIATLVLDVARMPLHVLVNHLMLLH